MIHVLNNLLVENDIAVDAMERKLDDLVDLLTFINLKNEQTLKSDQIKKNKGISEASDEDKEGQGTAFVDQTTILKVGCYNCEEFVHKKEDGTKF